MTFRLILRIALACGLAIDAFVGTLALFAQPLIQPLLDIPVKDPTLMTIYGGALIVLACVYALAIRDPVRFRPLIWLCALDQTLGVLLPLLEIARGHASGTWKIYGPMPFQLALVAIYVGGVKRSERPS